MPVLESKENSRSTRIIIPLGTIMVLQKIVWNDTYSNKKIVEKIQTK